MTLWSEIGAYLTLNARPALEVGIALLARTALPLAAALSINLAARRFHPRSRRALLSIGLATTMAAILMSFCPMSRAPAFWSVSLPNGFGTHATSLVRRPDATTLQPTPITVAISSAASVGGSLHDPAVMMTDRYSAPVPVVRPESPAPVRANVIWVYVLALLVWVGGSLASLASLCVGRHRLARLCARAVPCTDPDLLAELRIVCQASNARIPALLISPDALGPFASGVLRPQIVLPKGMLGSTDAAMLRAVLAHELHHIISRDCAWTLVARIASSFLWPQPLVWALVRRRRDAAEDACDEAALAYASAPQAYARYLLIVAESFSNHGRRVASGIGIADSRSMLGRRVERILNYHERDLRKMSTRSTTATIGLFCLLLAAGSRFVSAQSTEPSGPNFHQEGEIIKAVNDVPDSQAATRDDVVRSTGRAESAEQKRASSQSVQSGNQLSNDRERARAEVMALRARIDALERMIRLSGSAEAVQPQVEARAERNKLIAIEGSRAKADYERSRSAKDAANSSEDVRAAIERERASAQYSRAVRDQIAAHAGDDEARAAYERANGAADAQRKDSLDTGTDYNRTGVGSRLRAEEHAAQSSKQTTAAGADSRLDGRSEERAENLSKLRAELQRQESSLLELLQRSKADSPEALAERAQGNALRLQLELLRSQQEGAKLEERNAKEKALLQSARLRAEMAVADARRRQGDHILAMKNARMSTERAHMAMETRALRAELAVMRAELEQLRRRQDASRGERH